MLVHADRVGSTTAGRRCGAALFLLLGLTLGPALPAHSQMISGDLVVRVSDPTDLIVTGATLSLVEIETGIAHAAD